MVQFLGPIIGLEPYHIQTGDRAVEKAGSIAIPGLVPADEVADLVEDDVLLMK